MSAPPPPFGSITVAIHPHDASVYVAYGDDACMLSDLLGRRTVPTRYDKTVGRVYSGFPVDWAPMVRERLADAGYGLTINEEEPNDGC